MTRLALPGCLSDGSSVSLSPTGRARAARLSLGLAFRGGMERSVPKLALLLIPLLFAGCALPPVPVPGPEPEPVRSHLLAPKNRITITVEDADLNEVVAAIAKRAG